MWEKHFLVDQTEVSETCAGVEREDRGVKKYWFFQGGVNRRFQNSDFDSALYPQPVTNGFPIGSQSGLQCPSWDPPVALEAK